ncbi:DUF4129 domain-containing protein [Halobaculum sp. MBLA0147]|uniref:DUF4129 domain-containing protein n=1 Tax=Halobaculum sp. MBLA0147 TaxID=3079934 RepID=UPI0035269616
MVDRRTAATALLAVAAVLALGVSAATLTSTTSTDTASGFGVGPSGDQAGTGPSESSSAGASEDGAESPSFWLCIPLLNTLPARIAVAGLIGGVLLLFYRETGSLFLSTITVASISAPFLFFYFTLTRCSGPTELDLAAGTQQNASGFLPEGGGAAGAAGSGTSASTPTVLLAVLLLLAAAGAVGLLLYSTSDDVVAADDDESDQLSETRAAAVGSVAGEAADRLEDDADVENEVYRAWREMTTHLDVPRPRSSTPAEFAAAAVDAGMAREDVTALTEVFEEVRYGDRDVTTDRERRAVEALRNLEATYADESGAPEDGADGTSDRDGRTDGGDRR